MSSWKQAEIYELKHPKLSGTLKPAPGKGRWRLDLMAGNSNFSATVLGATAQAAQKAADREMVGFLNLVERYSRGRG